MFDKSLIIAVDFDGTCVTHDYPTIGKDIGAVPILRRLTEAGHRLVLWTMRSEISLNKAKDWFSDNDIPLWAAQYNPEQLDWTTSPKCFANLYIDDAALGCPLMMSSLSTRPYVDWHKVEQILVEQGIITYV